uniref:Uncharacterized 5.8 kDa protein in puhA 5'region n=1 Tax=Rhodobacter capsulatus TaxID=1061 RepID=YPU3_RHOCA|nr:RecName: Full=Uncharacterized 5.8 kDa protein in puhA 5'region; AltName: Full=ORF55 [Rhodobacter capsulatus]CAA77517.1 55 aa (6 kD) gene product of ORF55 [Rhodobacter capsulatus]
MPALKSHVRPNSAAPARRQPWPCGSCVTAPVAVRIGAMGASPGPARRPHHRGCRA